MGDKGAGSCRPQGRVCLASSAGTGARAPGMDSVSLSSLLPSPARPVLVDFRGTETGLGSWLLPEGESPWKGFWFRLKILENIRIGLNGRKGEG